VGLIGYDNKTKLGYGNISKRLSGNNFVITGSQTGHIKDLDGSQYCIIKEVDFTSNSVKVEGPIAPSSESITHASCYYSNEKIQNVIHIHNESLWKNLLNAGYPSTSVNAEYGSRKLSNEISDIAKNADNSTPHILVMEGHYSGLIAFGKDLEEVYQLIYKLYKEYAL
jgi:hypothetical protein